MFKIKTILSIIFIFTIWGCVSSAYPILLWWSRECVLYLIIIIKPEVWIINHCLGLGHETMVCAVCLTMFLCSFDIVHRRIYTSVGVTESIIMPLYDHVDRTITETDTSSRWLPGLSLGALKLAFSASGDGWGGHPGDVSVSLMKSPCIHIYLIQCLNALRPRQDGCLFADDILKCIFLNLNSWIPNKISWKYVTWRLIDNKPSMVKIMGCRRAGDNPIIWTIDGIVLLTHILRNSASMS